MYYFSVVEFTNSSDMKYAMEKLDGTEINGKKIKLCEDRARGGGGGGRRRYTNILLTRLSIEIGL